MRTQKENFKTIKARDAIQISTGFVLRLKFVSVCVCAKNIVIFAFSHINLSTNNECHS